MIPARLFRAFALSLLILGGACATAAPNPQFATGVIAIQVVNETGEMIQLFYENEHRLRRRVGTVLPLSSASFTAPLGEYGRGRFVARRLGQPEPFYGLQDHIDPRSFTGTAILIKLHPVPDLDHWTIRR